MPDISIFFAHLEEAAQQEGLPLQEVCRLAKGFGFDAVEMDAARLETDGDALLAAAENRRSGTVLQIAYACGFESQSTFYRAYRKLCGTSPCIRQD